MTINTNIKTDKTSTMAFNIRTKHVLILFLLLCFGVSQGQRLNLSSTTSGTIPLGTSVNIYLVPNSGCPTPTVSSTNSWSFNPSPSSTPVFSGDRKSVQVAWNTTVNASVTVSYTCTPGGNSDTSNPININYANVTPSFDVAFNGALTACGGGGGTLSAINVAHAGSQPVYSFYDGTENLHSGGSPSFDVTNLGPGSHNLTMRLLSSETGTSVTSNNVIWVTVLPRTSVTATMYVNGPICANSPVAKASVNVDGGASPYKYIWYYKGSPIYTTYDGTGANSGVRGNYYDYQNVQQGDKLQCKVESLNSSTTTSGCADSPMTQEYTVDIDTSTPSISITTVTNSLCENSSYDFTPSKQATSYLWKLLYNNVVRVTSTSRIFTLTATTSTDGSNYEAFGPNSVITLEVDGLASSGCAGNSYAASTTLYGSSFVIHPTPSTELTPSGNVVFCTTCVPILTAPSGANYSYLWFRGSAIIPGQTARTLTTDVEDSYRVKVSDVFCSATSSPTTLKRNSLPLANAGDDQNLALPLSSVTLNGSGSDVDGPVTFAWSKISGPSITLGPPTNVASLSLTNISIGVYVFRLLITDNTGESSYDDVTITIDPANNFNFVKEQTINVEGATSYVAATSLTIGDRNESITYFDGLGRPLQTVATQSAPLPFKSDIVQPTEYDLFGREQKKFLPFVSSSTDGWFKVDALGKTNYSSSEQYLFYNNGLTDKIEDNARPFSETIFEASPLNRSLRDYGPGVEWKNQDVDKFVQHRFLIYEYGTSPGQEQIFDWEIEDSGDLKVSNINSGYYLSGQLSIRSTTDERGFEVREYVDKSGRMVCRKVQSDVNQFASTYYVYDDLGNLKVVIPPEGFEKIKSLAGND